MYLKKKKKKVVYLWEHALQEMLISEKMYC